MTRGTAAEPILLLLWRWRLIRLRYRLGCVRWCAGQGVELALWAGNATGTSLEISPKFTTESGGNFSGQIHPGRGREERSQKEKKEK